MMNIFDFTPLQLWTSVVGVIISPIIIIMILNLIQRIRDRGAFLKSQVAQVGVDKAEFDKIKAENEELKAQIVELEKAVVELEQN